MSRYIDADNILYKDLSEGRGVCLVAFKDWIDKMPSADVVEVVRCKDCKHYCIWQMKCDRLHLVPIADNHYCSYGERSEA